MDPNRQILLETSRFRVVRAAQGLADGSVHYREIVEHPGAVVVIPMVDDQHVCLIENYRIAVDRTLVELPAGTLDPGEEPGTTAVRELAEETGYRAAEMTPLCQFFMSPGMLDERMHVYLARQLTPGPNALEAGEQIQTRIVAWPEAMAMALDGGIQDAKTLVGLFYYDRVREAR